MLHAGKTSLLYKLKDDEFNPQVPTVGLNVEQIKYRNMQLTLWDVGGQARKLWRHYYDKVDGLIFVVDSTDTDRMPMAKSEIEKIMSEDGLAKVPMLILANKQDLESAQTEKEISDNLALHTITRKDVVYHGCSARTGDGIWESVARLADLMDLVGKKADS